MRIIVSFKFPQFVLVIRCPLQSLRWFTFLRPKVESFYSAKNKKEPPTGRYLPISGTTDFGSFLSKSHPDMISLYFPDTQPTWLPTFTACQPLAAVATCSNTVPSAAAVMRA